MDEVLAVIVECLYCGAQGRVISRFETVENALRGHPAATTTIMCPDCHATMIVDLAGLLQAGKEAYERDERG